MPKSEKWNNITSTVRTTIKADDLKTEKQWLSDGYIKIDNECGRFLYTNQYCQGGKRLYLFPDEVRTATPEELDRIKSPARAKAKETRQRRKEQLEKEELERLNITIKAVNENSRLKSEIDRLVRFFAENVNSADTNSPQSTAEVIVIDTETTGLAPGKDELLQVSIISEDSNTLYNSYLKPIKTKSWTDAQKVNHISPEMIEIAPRIYEEIRKINALTSNAKIVIGYNTYFDINFLVASGCTFRHDVKIIDVMEDFAEVYGEWSDNHNSFKWQKLSKCAEYCGYVWGNDTAHDSLSDCKATLFCYQELKKEKYEKIRQENLAQLNEF